MSEDKTVTDDLLQSMIGKYEVVMHFRDVILLNRIDCVHKYGFMCRLWHCATESGDLISFTNFEKSEAAAFSLVGKIVDVHVVRKQIYKVNRALFCAFENENRIYEAECKVAFLIMPNLTDANPSWKATFSTSHCYELPPCPSNS